MLQRKFFDRNNRAAKLIDLMEQKGWYRRQWEASREKYWYLQRTRKYQ
ncbi:hypothetical protein [Sinobaca sp. H24]|nr:hypothetical protein [Sinobaca sp. H24]